MISFVVPIRDCIRWSREDLLQGVDVFDILMTVLVNLIFQSVFSIFCISFEQRSFSDYWLD
jgi:hypothetical protein